MHAQDTQWLTPLNTRQKTDIRLICFSQAGADPEQFRSWAPGLSQHIELLAFTLPGHGTRQSEAPYEQWSPLLADAFTALEPYLSEPHALFGHGLGAILCYELAKLTEARYPGRTRHLFVSGCRSPGSAAAPLSLNGLPAPQLRRALLNLSAPGKVTPELGVMDYQVLLRSDLKLLESWPPSNPHNLNVPMTALYGSDDPLAPLESMFNWRDSTAREFELIEVGGNHFFITTARQRLLQIINTHLGLLSE